ncbi:class I SAM-dependent methyltransferase [Nocardia asteroides]|uniref:class I SAM-dependent methyltransferase n=1 Tax=Nocardia asteroides TaxID=1824 RepID=UPI0037AE8890
MADSDTDFDAKLDVFREWQATPWGRLRYAVAAANLARHLPTGSSLRVLDVGGGNGLDALGLAVKGHHVTIADISEPALRAARALASEHDVADRILTRQVAADALVDAFGAGTFDVVLCHNVIQYASDPVALLRDSRVAVSRSGIVSVIAPNADADPLITAVRSHDLDLAFDQLGGSTRHTATYDTSVRACYADRTEEGMAGTGLKVVAHYGIRSVCDLIVDDELKADPRFYDRLEQLETAMATRPAYRATARFFHLVATPVRDESGAG